MDRQAASTMMASTTLSSVLWKYFSPRSRFPQMYMMTPGT
jgi:hypothetical protein